MIEEAQPASLEEWAAELAGRLERGEIACAFCGVNPARQYLGAGICFCGDCPRETPIGEPFGGAEEFNPSCECCTCEWTAADGTAREGCPAEIVWGGGYFCLLCYLEAEAEATGNERWVEAFWRLPREAA